MPSTDTHRDRLDWIETLRRAHPELADEVVDPLGREPVRLIDALAAAYDTPEAVERALVSAMKHRADHLRLPGDCAAAISAPRQYGSARAAWGAILETAAGELGREPGLVPFVALSRIAGRSGTRRSGGRSVLGVAR